MLLSQIWAARSKRRRLGVPTLSQSVVAACVARVRAVIRHDWLRVTSDVRQLSGAGCIHWFKGRDPSLTVAAFEKRWCHGGVLASVGAGRRPGQHRLRLRLSVSTLPVGGAPGAGPGGADAAEGDQETAGAGGVSLELEASWEELGAGGAAVMTATAL